MPYYHLSSHVCVDIYAQSQKVFVGLDKVSDDCTMVAVNLYIVVSNRMWWHTSSHDGCSYHIHTMRSIVPDRR